MACTRILCLLALFAGVPGLAADIDGNFVVKGVGSSTCQAFVDASKAGGDELGQFGGYVAGYTSAFNQIQNNTFDVWRWQTIDTVMLFLLERCQKVPSLNFGAAVASFTHHLDASKVESLVRNVRIGDDTTGFFLYEPVYQDLLKALEQAGYPTDDPYAALVQYKKANRVSDTKNVNQVLLLRLLGRVPPEPVSP